MPGPEHHEDPSGSSAYGSALRTAGPLLTSGLQMAAGIVFMGFLGYLLDLHWSTQPWLMVVGIVFGAGAGMYLFIRTAIAVGSKEKQEEVGPS
jgi:F0F1-type ATP synthase assembly protein I